MSTESLWPSLLAVAGILFFTVSIGWATVGLLFPRGSGWSLERLGWSLGIAALFLALNVVLCFTLGLRPGWISLLALAAVGVVLGRRFSLPRKDCPPDSGWWRSPVSWLLLAVTGAGVWIYLVRSLTEPMWSNDFVAIWGLKGKTIFGDVGIPQRLFQWPEFEFSNPAYPIGLPLLYAGVAFLLGRWEDHAMALLFPLFQVGTLLVLVGWLLRRGVSGTVALAASAVIANFGMLYSAWLTGMAEVPASFTFLLVGMAFCDALEDTDAGCLRRLSLAALLASATKNEGVVLVATAFALLLLRAVRRRERRMGIAAVAVLIPAIGSFLVHRLVLGSHAIRGLDFGLLWRPGLSGRVVETLREEFTQLVRPAWPALVAVLVLATLARRTAATKPIVLLAAVSLLIYLALPVVCPFGPGWLVHWTVGRITVALVPLLAAGIAMGWGYRRQEPAARNPAQIISVPALIPSPHPNESGK